MGVPMGDNRVAQDTHKATLGARFLPSLQKIRTRDCRFARAAKMPVSCGTTSPTPPHTVTFLTTANAFF